MGFLRHLWLPFQQQALHVVQAVKRQHPDTSILATQCILAVPRKSRVVNSPSASKNEGVGNAGRVVRTRGLACRMKKAYESVHHGCAGSPGIPAREWF
jgi:hypothetical protein